MGTISQPGCSGVFAGQGRVRTPPDSNTSLLHSLSSEKHRLGPTPHLLSAEPLPQVSQSGPTPLALRTTPSPAPQSQFQDPRGQGKEKERPGVCPRAP